jgi:hypothetical protein
MKKCYLCVDLISKRSDDNFGSACPDCGVNYCSKCSLSVSSCFICGKVTEKYVPDPEFSSNVEKIFADKSFIAQRKYPRDEIMVPVEYFYSFETEAKAQLTKQISAITKNISKGGMCIITSAKHDVGERLEFTDCSVCSDNSSAEVLWSRTVDKTLTITGLEFV